MDLPPEVCVIIYKYCPTFGKIFPYLEKQFAEEKMHGDALWPNAATTPPSSTPQLELCASDMSLDERMIGISPRE